MNNKLVSIIIPCYNVQNYLFDCFESLKNQTYKQIQVVFINDGSTDNTLKLLTDFCNSNSNCKLINQENKGICVTRNIGIQNADGEFVYFMDPDDIIHPNAIKHQVNLIESTNADIVCSGIANINEKKTYSDLKFKDFTKSNNSYFDKDEIFSRYIGSRKGATNKLFRNNIFKKIKTYPKVADENIKYGEDMNIVASYLLESNSICFDKNITYYWRLRKNSETTKPFNVGLISSLDCLNPFYVLDENEFPKTHVYIKSSISITAFYVLYRINKSNYSDIEKIKEIYNLYKNNLKYLKKCKYYPWYIKYLFVFSKPLAWSMYKKILKRINKK